MQISFLFLKKKKKHLSLKQQYCNMIYMYFDIMHKKSLNEMKMKKKSFFYRFHTIILSIFDEDSLNIRNLHNLFCNFIGQILYQLSIHLVCLTLRLQNTVAFCLCGFLIKQKVVADCVSFYSFCQIMGKFPITVTIESLMLVSYGLVNGIKQLT